MDSDLSAQIEKKVAEAIDSQLGKRVKYEVRGAFSEDAAGHRQFLERQFNRIVWGVGILGVVGAGLFTYFLSGSFDEMRETTKIEVDNKILEYRINDGLKNHIAKLTQVIVDEDEFKERINGLVQARADTLVPEAVNSAVAENLKRNVDALEKADIPLLVESATKSEFAVIRGTIQANSERVEAVSARLFGGAYSINDCDNVSPDVSLPNPLTGATSCPVGFQPGRIARVRGSEVHCGVNVYVCLQSS